jgi:hypothetical protein
VEVDDDKLIDALGAALRYSGAALGDVPELLKRVLETGIWRDFTTQRRERVHHERFVDFVTAQPLAGLGADVDLIRRLVADDDEATRKLREVLKEKPGRKKSRNNITGSTRGDSRAYLLERLERERPDLLADVIAKRSSAHAAAIEAGFRPRTITVRADSPTSIAATLRRQLTPDDLRELARLLRKGA